MANNSKDHPQVKMHKGWLIVYNMCLAIFLSAGLVAIIAYASSMPSENYLKVQQDEKINQATPAYSESKDSQDGSDNRNNPPVSARDLHAKLHDFVRKYQGNPSDAKKEFKEELLEFLKGIQYKPSLDETGFKDKFDAFLKDNSYEHSQSVSELEFVNKLRDFLLVNQATLVRKELQDSSNERTYRFVFIYTLAAMFVGGAIGGILCNLCGSNLIAFLNNNQNNPSPSEIDFNDKLLCFIEEFQKNTFETQKEFKEELLEFLKCNQYIPTQREEGFKNKLHEFLEKYSYKSSQSVQDLKAFKNKLLEFLIGNRSPKSAIALYLRPFTGAVTGLLAFFVGNLLETSLSIDATQKGWETLPGRLPYVAVAILAGYASPEFMTRLKKLAQTMFSETDKNKG
ncbi:MAG: hypothetical protein MRK02_12685 [Candidatus Scalindua sp.]|nr:hypothetical protein [Candidatus Scalindua sp.]